MFLGDLDRYEWKLLWQKEAYIPYNNQKLYATRLTSSSRPII